MERYQEKFEEWYNNDLFDEETKKQSVKTKKK